MSGVTLIPMSPLCLRYLSVLPLDGVVLPIIYIDCPLVVVLQWRSYHQLPEAVGIHVR